MKTRKEIGDKKGYFSIYVIEKFIDGDWVSTGMGDGNKRWTENQKMQLEELYPKEKYRIILYVRKYC